MAVTRNRKTGKVAFQSRTFRVDLRERLSRLCAERFLTFRLSKQETMEAMHNVVIEAGLEVLEAELGEAQHAGVVPPTKPAA